jgi:hypothetical protein
MRLAPSGLGSRSGIFSCGLGAALALCFLSLPARGATTATNLDARASASSEDALEGHWHEVKVRRYHDRISITKKINPVWWFGNLDEPTPPADYRPRASHRNLDWHVRNSLHNFTYFVVGISDKPFRRAGRYPSRTMNPHDGWNVAVSKYRWLRLPFVSYKRGEFNFYFGWRTRGNFGIKFNFQAPPPPATNKPAMGPIVMPHA